MARLSDTTHCTSCGERIPPGQGRSCSMCYGDINHGRDGYYRDWAERQERDADERRERDREREEQ